MAKSIFLIPLFFVLWPCADRAAEPQQEILDGLRAKGDFAAAIDYLEKVRTNTGLPKEFAEKIDYELALAHIDAARQANDEQRDRHYELAYDALKKFLAEHPKQARADAARTQLGGLLLDRARLARSLANERVGAAREKLMQAARGFLAEADKLWADIDAEAEADLKKIVFKRGEEIRRTEARDEIHRRQAQARLGRAWAQFEKGLTYESGAGERTAALQEAARQFDAIYQRQRQRLAGFYAQLGRGMCDRESGESEKAFAVFEELFGQLPDEPTDFRALRGRAAVQALEIALRPEVKKYKQGLDIAQRWIGGQNSAAEPSDFDLAIRFLGAEAAEEYVKALPPPTAEQAGIRSRQLDWIRQQYAKVAAADGPYQAAAKTRSLGPTLGGPPAADAPAADSLSRVKAAVDRLLAARVELQAARRNGAGNNADTLRQRQEQIDAARTEALKICQQALEDKATAGDLATTLRYYQAYLQYDAGDLTQAAADGEAAMNSSGDSLAVRQAAGVALAAREAIYHQAASRPDVGAAKADGRARLAALAVSIAQRWPSFPEADDARANLAELAVAEGQIDKAENYLPQIALAAPRRGEAELAIGEACWARAQQLLRVSTLEHDHSTAAEKLAARAAELLRDGIGRVQNARSGGLSRKDGIEPPETGTANRLLGAVVALAQVELSEGHASKAAELLQGEAELPNDALPLALLAEIAAGQLDRAAERLHAIEASLPAGADSDSPRQTIAACMRFQWLLKQHLARYRERRFDAALKQLVAQCDAFLAGHAPDPSASFFFLAWRAEAYAGLAAGLDSADASERAVSPDAREYYRRATAAFRELLHRAAAQPHFAPAAELVVALRIDLARCLRRCGENAQALSQLLEVLKEHPLMVDAQVEAAYTYQSWGEDKPEYLEMAMQGGNRYREVWGWDELARRVQPESRFHDIFHVARYNLAYCHFRQAQSAVERQERKRLAQAAKGDVLATRRADGDMGGPVWYDRYNELFQRIQRLAGEPAAGLPSP